MRLTFHTSLVEQNSASCTAQIYLQPTKGRTSSEYPTPHPRKVPYYRLQIRRPGESLEPPDFPASCSSIPFCSRSAKMCEHDNNRGDLVSIRVVSLPETIPRYSIRYVTHTLGSPQLLDGCSKTSSHRGKVANRVDDEISHRGIPF